MQKVKDIMFAVIVMAILIVAMMLVTGCAQVGQLVNQGAELNDEALATAEFTICNAASVGSVKRRYNTPERVETWRQLCDDKTEFTPE